MNKKLFYKNHDLVVGRYTAYQNILSMLIGLGVLIIILKALIFEDMRLSLYFAFTAACMFVIFMVIINIKFILQGNVHIYEMHINKNTLKLVNYYAQSKVYCMSDLIDIESFANESEFLRIASYLSSEDNNYRIKFSDGRIYFLNGSSDEAKSIAKYLKSRLRVIE